MKNLSQQLGTEFSEETRILLIEAVKRAYNTAIGAYDPISGSNNSTFGCDLYWFCVHELKVLAQDETTPIELIRERPDFRLRIGSCVLACHRVGSDLEQDISISFPNNNRAAGQLARSNSRQMFLPGFENFNSTINQGIDELNIVLAHIGNPFDGVCSVYLCLPIHEENGRIIQWGYTDLLWKTDDLKHLASSTQELPEEAPIEPAIVRLKPKKKEEKANGDDL